MKNLFSVLRYVRGYWKYAVLNILSNILSVFFSLFSLAMIAPFLKLLFATEESAYKETMALGKPAFEWNVNYLIKAFNYFLTQIIVDNGKIKALILICVLVVVVIFLKNLFKYLGLFFLAPVRNGVVRDIRNSTFSKILALPLSYYSEERKGDIMSRLTADVHEIEWSVMTGLEMLFRDPVNIIVFLITMIVMSAKLTLFVFILLPIAGLMIGMIGKSLRKTSAKGKGQMGSILSIIEETLSGLRVIKGFNAEAPLEKKFYHENEQYTKTMIRMYRKTDLSSPLSEFLGTVVLVIVMYFGGLLVLGNDPSLRPEAFITYIAIFSQLIPPSKALTTAYYNVQKGAASADRIYQILNAEETIKDKQDAVPLKSFEKEIEYRDVSFAYRAGEVGWVLKDINLKIEKGKTIALVGQSGSGKTTLADMLPRFYEPSKGEILIDGVPLKSIKIKDSRALMGIVTQESILFNDTVFNNIVLGIEGATEEQVIEAAKIANAHEFISKMKDGYHTNIGDRGSKLSGGQRQRISIARAVLKNPPILILDEATSALDTESERLVQDALYKLMQNRTSVVIAHRLSTIQHADEIIVLQKGEIIEKGKHAELLALGGVYKKLYDLQAFV